MKTKTFLSIILMIVGFVGVFVGPYELKSAGFLCEDLFCVAVFSMLFFDFGAAMLVDSLIN